MSAKLFLISSIGGLLLTLLAVALLNFHTDRFGIFSADFKTFYQGIQPNRHYLKTRYILEHPERSHCFLFGSSRVGSIPAEQLDHDCFNFTHAGGMPVHHARVLNLFIERGVEIDTVYIGLDDLSYTWDPDDHQTEYQRRGFAHSPRERLETLAFYLLRVPSIADWTLLNGQRERIVNRWLVLSQREPEPDSPQDPAQRRQRFYHIKPTLSGWGRHIERSIAALRQIKALSSRHGFELILFFNPMHYKTYLANELNVLAQYKRQLAGIQPYWDFSGLNAVTLDDQWWEETSHYTHAIGEQITEVLRGGPSDFDRFERWTTAQNVDALRRAEHRHAAARYPAILARSRHVLLPAELADITIATGASTDRPLALGAYRPSARLALTRLTDHSVQLVASGLNTALAFPDVALRDGHFYILRFDVTTEREGWMSLDYANQSGRWLTGQRLRARVYRGTSRVALPILPTATGKGLRLTLPRGAGTYRLSDLSLYRVQGSDPEPTADRGGSHRTAHHKDQR